ncbi:MAG TPA: glycosyltransferase [Candidatus Tumulicola sp.]
MRVLFLSASVGVGHLSAAGAVCEGLRTVDPAVRTEIVDSYEYAALVVSRVVSDGYIQMVKTIPQMYRYIYDRAERATEVGPFRTWAHQFTAENLHRLLQRWSPDAVVCTHAFPCGAMAEYKRMYADAPPVVGIVTDYAVHGFWLHADIDAYAVASDRVRSTMIARGIDPSRVAASGIPVRPEFAPNPERMQYLRERLNLPRDGFVVLMMGGGLGIGPLERMMRALKTVDLPLTLVVIAGRNARSERRVLETAQNVSYPVRVLSFVDNVYDYMHAADVFISKPGGLSVAEALVAGVPLVLYKPLPGQEERNARVVTEAGAGLRVRRLDDLATTMRRVLTDADLRASLQAGARTLARPNAAGEAASMIARLVSLRKAVVA